jgi:hypothetical protein
METRPKVTHLGHRPLTDKQLKQLADKNDNYFMKYGVANLKIGSHQLILNGISLRPSKSAKHLCVAFSSFDLAIQLLQEKQQPVPLELYNHSLNALSLAFIIDEQAYASHFIKFKHYFETHKTEIANTIAKLHANEPQKNEWRDFFNDYAKLIQKEELKLAQLAARDAYAHYANHSILFVAASRLPLPVIEPYPENLTRPKARPSGP